MTANRPPYQEITAATARLLADGLAVISPGENSDVFDVSLVAGHAGMFEGDALEFDNLAPFVHEALHALRSFEMLEVVPYAQTHLTIFPVFQNKPRAFASREHLQSRTQQYDQLVRALEGLDSLTVFFEGLCLAPTGAVILQGFCEAMPAVRLRLSQALPDTQRTVSHISHVTLARLRRPANRVEFRELFDWCAQWQHRDRNTLEIVHPRLVATGDQNGTVILDGEIRTLSEWNRRIPKLCSAEERAASGHKPLSA